MRIFQGVGGAMLIANCNAIITGAFAVDQRGLALGLNRVAGIAGAFLVSVPVGLFAALAGITYGI